MHVLVSLYSAETTNFARKSCAPVRAVRARFVWVFVADTYV